MSTIPARSNPPHIMANPPGFKHGLTERSNTRAGYGAAPGQPPGLHLLFRTRVTETRAGESRPRAGRPGWRGLSGRRAATLRFPLRRSGGRPKITEGIVAMETVPWGST